MCTMWLGQWAPGVAGHPPLYIQETMYSLVAKKLIPLYEFLYEFLLCGV